MEGWQVSFTCTLACRQGAHFCLCRDRRISVTLNLHKSRAISQRLASSVGIRYTNKVFEQDSARNYCLLVQHNATCRVRVDPGNDGVGPVVWSALLMTGCLLQNSHQCSVTKPYEKSCWQSYNFLSSSRETTLSSSHSDNGLPSWMFSSPGSTFILDERVQLTVGLQTQERHLILFSDMLIIAKSK